MATPAPADPVRVVDPSAVLARVVGFARALDAAGIATDPASAIDFVRALRLVDIGSRAEVHAAGSAVFVRRRDDLPVYDAVFAAFWRTGGVTTGAGPAAPVDGEQPEPQESTPLDAAEDARSVAGDESARPSTAGAAPTGEMIAVPEGDAGTPEGVMVAPDAYSRGEVLRHKAFDRMTPAELREAERLIDLLAPRLETRRTRRHELHHHGRVLAPRVMFRRNLATGGDLVDWVWQRPVRRPRQIVVICDISGSMERDSRVLLRFVQALSSSRVKTEAFVFGTRLTRVTRELRDRDPDRALARVSDAVTDWAGGTRIGDSFREFNQRWARRVLRTSGVVIVVSDGWDRGDVALVGHETARLARSCHRLIWLNPLASADGYRPLAGGMAAAYPYVDDFVAAGSVASLERLGEILGGVRDPVRDPRWQVPGHAGAATGGRPATPRVWRAREGRGMAGAKA